MLRAVLSVPVLMLLAAMLAGCQASDPGAVVAFHELSPAAEPARQTLKAGDRVQVTVFGEDAITGAYDVAPTGAVQIPLAGSVTAQGRTARELEAGIATALQAKYLRNPKVTVSVLSVSPFYVLGEVEKPGEYPFRNGLNIWRALAIAGGQTYRASTASVFIQHAGDSRVAEVDLAQDVTIMPGDLIRVPERWF